LKGVLDSTTGYLLELGDVDRSLDGMECLVEFHVFFAHLPKLRVRVLSEHLGHAVE
jgi:hypothetical protein